MSAPGDITYFAPQLPILVQITCWFHSVPLQCLLELCSRSYLGRAFAPGQPQLTNFDRPFPDIGPVYIFKSSAGSSYDALQLQLRGRYNFLGATQFQVNYTYGKATDDASDVFRSGGGTGLAPECLTLAGELGPSNFDVRHRSPLITFPTSQVGAKPAISCMPSSMGLRSAGTGTFQTGQPFTVNSIFDVNLDGNLTDRLELDYGLVETDDGGRPLYGSGHPLHSCAVGENGKVQRNSFRASNLFLTNAAVIKTIRFSEDTKLVFRAEAFNLFNRANYGIPTRFLELPWFGKATDTVTPGRRIQFGLKLVF